MAFLFLTSQSGFGSDEKMRYVEINSCDKEFCVNLKTQELFKSSLGKIFAFGPSAVQIQSSGKLLKKNFSGYEGSFDPRIKRFYLSNNSDDLEYLIDIPEKKVIAYKKSD